LRACTRSATSGTVHDRLLFKVSSNSASLSGST